MSSFGQNPDRVRSLPHPTNATASSEAQTSIDLTGSSLNTGWETSTTPMKAVYDHDEASDAETDPERPAVQTDAPGEYKGSDDAPGWPSRRDHFNANGLPQRERVAQGIGRFVTIFVLAAVAVSAGAGLGVGLRQNTNSTHPVANAPSSVPYTPVASRKPNATPTITPAPATPTPTTPAKPTAPPPTPTPNTGPQWGEAIGATPTYSSPNINASQGAALPSGEADMYTCTEGGFDELQSAPQGADPYAPAADIRLEGPLPECETASVSPAQAAAMASLALGGPSAIWRPEV